jgi:EAL domain-containing protein (putative c-di-GMP-specific phosphodiesterase class I)
LTAWVLRRALSDQAQWSSMSVPWYVGVNISAHNLESPAFPASVIQLLQELDVAAHRLQLELTETALAADTTVALRGITELARHGVGIAVDDFGAGYTSMRQLRTLPVAEIKIDRIFVAGLATNQRDRSIVRTVIELAHRLGCLVTAEGVEDAETADWLTAAGCDNAQGFHFFRPQPWPDLLQLLANHDSAMAPSPSAPPKGLTT